MIPFLFLFNQVLAADSFNTTVTHDHQQALSLSIYQRNLALIKDTRRVNWNSSQAAEINLIWQEISSAIKPETAWLRNLSHPEFLQVTAQHFDLELLTPQKLLQLHSGKQIMVIRTHPVTGEEFREEATVVSTSGGVILRFSDRIETGIPGRLIFSEIPAQLREKPAMLATLNPRTADYPAQSDLQLTYLSEGLTWQADYILQIDHEERQAQLIGQATLTNLSGITYHNASLELIAGDLNQIREIRSPSAKRMVLASESVSTQSDTITADAQFELHRYSLPGKATLPDQQSRQITFLSAQHIPVKKIFRLQGQSYYYSSQHHQTEQKLPIDVYISFRNSGNSLGIPLPRGIMRTYLNNQDHDLQCIGEDQIAHTPNKETVQLKLGQAFDITANKKQMEFKKLLTADPATRQFETEHQIVFSNAKKEAVTVEVHEPIPGDWQIVTESHPHKKIASNMAQWQIRLPAESLAVLSYRVRITL